MERFLFKELLYNLIVQGIFLNRATENTRDCFFMDKGLKLAENILYKEILKFMFDCLAGIK